VADGLNHGILIGLAAGFISFIPYLGSFTGLVLSLCVVVLQFWPSWTMIPVVLGIFLAGQAIADYLLSPYLIASRVQLNPVWVMFAITAFGYLFASSGSSLRCRSPPRLASSSVLQYGNICSLRPSRRRLPRRKRSLPAQELAEVGLELTGV